VRRVVAENRRAGGDITGEAVPGDVTVARVGE
jgi:hypothetical protein